MSTSRILFTMMIFTIVVFSFAFTSLSSKTTAVQPVASTLYDTIVSMDSLWEYAYNHCRADIMNDVISEDLEFYHDRGGVVTSKEVIMEALKKNICNKVTRELKQGSIEVYEIPGYGAVEMGQHGFHNVAEPDEKIHFSKFVHLWKRENKRWRITRVISLH